MGPDDSVSGHMSEDPGADPTSEDPGADPTSEDPGADPTSEDPGADPTRDQGQFETMIRRLPDPVFVTDASGYLTDANAAFTEQFGYEPAEESCHVSEFIDDDDVDAILELLRELVVSDADGNESAVVEFEGRTRDGRTRILEGSLTLMPGEGGFAGFAAVVRDVTAQKRRKEVFTVMDRTLRHNLRSTVTVINLSSRVLQGELGDEHEEVITRITDSASWLETLGDRLRTLRNAIEESFERDQARAIEEIVRAGVDGARKQHTEAGADVTVHVSAGGEIGAPLPVELAVEEIVDNAITHNDSDEPTVEVWVAHAPADGWIDVHVEDNGPGIPALEREVVLGDATVDQLQHGSGMGLWIARWVVEVFDGELDIERHDPRGTVVTLRLPLAGRPDDEP